MPNKIPVGWAAIVNSLWVSGVDMELETAFVEPLGKPTLPHGKLLD